MSSSAAHDYEGLFDQLSEADIKPPSWRDSVVNRKLSPRMRTAAKLYGSSIAKTLGEAAKLANLAPSSVYIMSAGNDEFNQLVNVSQKERDIATGDISAVLQRLGRSGLATIERLRESAESEAIQLKAAIDLADRSPETSKVQKLSIASISLDGKDVAEINRSLVEAAQVHAQYAELAKGDFVTVTTELPTIEQSAALPRTLPPVSEEDPNGV